MFGVLILATAASLFVIEPSGGYHIFSSRSLFLLTSVLVGWLIV